MRRMALVLCGMMAASAANAQRGCASYTNQIVTPVSIDSALSSFSGLGPKGEFETTAQYQARRAAALGGSATRPLIISKVPEGQNYFEYNADAGVLGIKSYAFHNTTMDTFSAFYTAGAQSKIPVSTISNIEALISRTESVIGAYTAGNAYGAQVEVSRIQWTTKAIFDRESNLSEGLFPAADNSPYLVGTLAVPPAAAQRLKPTLQVAFVVVPKEPFTVSGTHKPGRVTIQNPRDITEDFSILIADIQCGLLLDEKNRVLGSYPTR